MKVIRSPACWRCRCSSPRRVGKHTPGPQSVHERRRESALLRALGVTRGQVKGMLALEGLLLAGVGTVLGVPSGSPMDWQVPLGLLGLSDIPHPSSCRWVRSARWAPRSPLA